LSCIRANLQDCSCFYRNASRLWERHSTVASFPPFRCKGTVFLVVREMPEKSDKRTLTLSRTLAPQVEFTGKRPLASCMTSLILFADLPSDLREFSPLKFIFKGVGLISSFSLFNWQIDGQKIRLIAASFLPFQFTCSPSQESRPKVVGTPYTSSDLFLLHGQHCGPISGANADFNLLI
jgi:hypothetical protein